MSGKILILKIKDWPTSDDFEKVLPKRFNDLMSNIPIKDYTDRNGRYNIVSSLPDTFLKPDLGPKLYIAYSSADTPKEATTCLHLDISDAVNILMYVGDTYNSEIVDKNIYEKSPDHLYNLLVQLNCDEFQLRRYLTGEKPGAVWHIFKPEDADTIRTFLKIVSLITFFIIVNFDDLFSSFCQRMLLISIDKNHVRNDFPIKIPFMIKSITLTTIC
jgi:[histone H3]-dimethyl-L-lysine9 demethylase